MKRIVTLVLFFGAALSAQAANRPPAEQEKIAWLLSEVQHADAVFIRNGKEYDGGKAAAHLKSKLWFAGNRVQTAREFIVGIASHSQESGKPYEIRLKDGAQEPLARWLMERLEVFEKGNPGGRPAVTPARWRLPARRSVWAAG